ncbi:MAG: TrmO family methyltransferase [Deltaproteobacteria bacterium]|jgi:L-fuculose-phosphate aldolase|nr:TrmO family methyltransferase [Deltaproteobacteria bacterium]
MSESDKTGASAPDPNTPERAEESVSFFKRDAYYGATFDTMLETFSGDRGTVSGGSGLQLSVIGWVRSSLQNDDDLTDLEKAPEAVLEILPDFAPGLDGLEAGHKITLVTWSHLAEREVLQCAPAGGVFSSCQEARPNPISISEAFITGVERQSATALVRLSALLVRDGTPVLDIKRSGRPGNRVDLELESAKNRLVKMCALGHAAGLLPAFNGNASLRLGSQCLVTSSGTMKFALGPHDFAVLDLNTGGLISGHRPSSEAAMHLEIYRQQPAATVILHTHPGHLLGLGVRRPDLTMQGRLSMPLFEGGRWSSLVGNVDALMPGSRDLAEAVGEAAKTHQAVWMEKHGLTVWGQEALEVVGISEELNHLASIRLMGGFE